LKILNKTISGDRFLCELCLPNQEIKLLYWRLIETWFPVLILKENYQAMLKSLVTGEVNLFQELLEDCLSNSLSYFDVKGENPEKFYHALVLGMLVALQETHHIKSNRESGIGRYDIMIMPKDKSQLAIIIEFKSLRKSEDLDSGVQLALQQIQDKNYRQELENLGFANILELGIAFYGKQLKLAKR
jgi:hypothetical protein